MKKLLVLLFLILILPLSINAADVYYCSDDDNTGYDINDNLKHKMFKLDKFKIMIDFDNETITSEKKYFTSAFPQKCFTDTSLYCINSLGSVFAIKESTLNYYFADVFIGSGDNQTDPRLAHGTCEKF